MQITKTGDVMRAALMLSLGVPLIDASPDKTGGRLMFSFDDTNNQARLAGAAILQNRPVPIGSFMESWRKCREMLYQFHISQDHKGFRREKFNDESEGGR